MSSRDFVALFFLSIVGAALGFKPVSDLDLGWHLAGGLFALDTGGLPSSDPLGAEGSFWLAYSWLFELLVAKLYLINGFSALQGLQVVSVAALVWVFFALVYASAKDNKQCGANVRLVALLIALLLTSPIWYLRPQLYSVILFGFLVYFLNRDCLKWQFLIPLTLLWVNLHVYWIFVPLVVVLARILDDKNLPRAVLEGAGYSALGIVNPYGIAMFQGLFVYAFDHSIANQLILEFHPLAPKHGYVFWLFIFVLLAAVAFQKFVVKAERRSSIALFLLFAAASIVRVKFIPLFAVAAVPLVTRHLVPRLFERIGLQNIDTGTRSSDKRTWVIAIVLTAVFFVLAFATVRTPQAISEEHRELLEIAEQIDNSIVTNISKPVVVLNRFDDGGWLALGFYIVRGKAPTSQLRTSIDGRTLVMGTKRLTDYFTVTKGNKGWREVLRVWGVELAVLPLESELAQRLSASGWKEKHRGTYWRVLARI